MKKYIKGLFSLCVVFALTAAGVYAETTTTATTGKTSYDYQTNKVGITDTEKLADQDQELTVLVVKGNYTGDSTKEITSADVYYVDQESGSAFSCFQNLGLKQTDLDAGEYTLIAGGDNVAEPIKELMIIGDVSTVPNGLNKNNLNFGKVSDVKKIQKADNTYVYVCKCEMPKGTVSDSSKMGFIFQRKNDTQWQHLYKAMDLSKLSTVSIDANIEFGLQVNGITLDPDTIQFTAIPYAEKSTTTESTAEGTTN